ncbi:MAG: cytochrome c [Burkholderiaceae bacterium]
MSRRFVLRGILALVVLAVIVVGGGWLLLREGYLPKTPGVLPVSATTQALGRGEYLARVGDCVACHEAPGGKPFAGGRAMPTPFGDLYVPNITPDDETGIGLWTAADFYRMMHTGVSRDGSLLYPAMPFASYTKVSRADSDTLFAYLQSVVPVHQKNRSHELRFPYNQRDLLIGWRALYLKEGEYVPDATQTAAWNRGAYLVQGLGHCTLCHTAINALGGSSESKAFEGGMIPNQNWYAPSLTSNREAGLGDWSIRDISDLLQTGISHRGTVYGPMAEVVYNSLQYLTDDDANAMAVYLKALAPHGSDAPVPDSARLVRPAVMESGRRIYVKQCAVCHGDEGKGQTPTYPPLADNQSIVMASPVNAIRMVLNGGYPPGTSKNPRPHGMPPFAQVLKDEEVAAVLTYVRVAWGNVGTPVSPSQVNDLRKALPE